MRNVTQIILSVIILCLAVTLIPVVYTCGTTFYGSELGAQILIASFGFVIVVMQVCLFMILSNPQDHANDVPS